MNFKTIPFFLLIISISLSSRGQVYVNLNATGSNNGTSWTNAYTDLQNAINNSSNTQIWVAAGTYKPTSGTSRSISFSMKNNIEIYGGFIGNESMLSQRNLLTNPTILSGDIGIIGDSSDNSYHVIRNSNVTNGAILDGFTITKGFATSFSSNDEGAGIYNSSSTITIRNIVFLENIALEGGAVYNSSSNTFIYDCIFRNNSAQNGGAFNKTGSSGGLFLDCLFEDNSATSGSGGAYYSNSNSSSNMQRCVFNRNKASVNGGAIFTNMAAPMMDSCILDSNSATLAGGAIYRQGISTTLKNSMFTSNYTTSGVSNTGGGAIYHISSGSLISNCIFLKNKSASNGGALSSTNSIFGTITNCTFADNTTTFYGGAIYNSSATREITNCQFITDSALIGGAISNQASNATITNCTFNRNHASNTGGAFNNNGGNPIIKNSILWNNTSPGVANIFNSGATPSVSYSLIQGGYSGVGNISSNPFFYNELDPLGADNIWMTADDGLQITVNTPAKDQSDPSTTTPTVDIKSVSRNGFFDIGAFESNSTFPLPITDLKLVGYVRGDFNELNWLGNETIERFQLQHEVDDNFEVLHEIIIRNNEKLFRFKDYERLSSTYRIVAFDFDDNKTYSNTIVLSNTSLDRIVLSPNPLNNKPLKINIESSRPARYQCNVYNMQGVIVENYDFNVLAGFNQFELNLNPVTNNSLLITLSKNGALVESFKVVN